MWIVKSEDNKPAGPARVDFAPDPYETILTEQEKKLFANLIDGVKGAVNSMEGKPNWLDEDEATFLKKIHIFKDYTNAQNVLVALMEKLSVMSASWGAK